MAVQRQKLNSAYDNINWGTGVDTHVNEAARDFVDRKNKRYEEQKQLYADIGAHIKDVDAKDTEEALRDVETARNDIAESIKVNGQSSVAHLQTVAAIKDRLAASAQGSKSMAKDYLEAAAYVKSNPYIMQKQAEDRISRELAKPRSERSKTILRDIMANDRNFTQWTSDQIDKMSPEEKMQYVRASDDGFERQEVSYRGKFSKTNEKDPNKKDAVISDEAIDELIALDPDGWKRLAQDASRARANRSNEELDKDEYTGKYAKGDIMQMLADEGGGPEVEKEMIRAFAKANLATVHRDKIFPKESNVGFTQKSRVYDPTNTTTAYTQRQKDQWIDNLSAYIADGEAGLPAIQAQFAKTGDGSTRVVYNPDKNLVILKSKPAGREESADKKRRLAKVMQTMKVTKEDLAKPENAWLNDVLVDEVLSTAGANAGVRRSIAAAIHKKTGESQIDRDATAAPAGATKKPKPY